MSENKAAISPKHLQIHQERANIPFSEEVKDIVQQIEKDPKNPLLWMEKGIRIRRQMLFREAIEAYSIGLTYDPFFMLLYRHRGHSLVNIRRYKEAAADFEMALRLDPSNWDCWYHLGLAYHLMGDYNRAKTAYESCYNVSFTDDAKIATTDWYCMTLMKLGDIDGMKKAASRIHKDMVCKGSAGYFQRVLVYGGVSTPEEVLAIAKTQDDHMFATYTYGLAVYYEYVLNEKEKAQAIIREILEKDTTWGGFAEHAAFESTQN